jgi:circadian clock protein KaiB
MTKRAGKPRNEYASFQRALKESKERHYVLRLYVTGATPRSVRAISHIRQMCEEHLKDRYTLEVIDVYRQPELVKGQQLIAVPTLIKMLPAPLRKFIGDMVNTKRILLGLDLQVAQDETESQQ